MGYSINPWVDGVSPPPIADAKAWVAGREFGAERPLLDVCQAVPSYPPAASLREAVASAVRDDASALYTPILGLPALRTALAAYMSNAYGGVDVRPSDVAITAGCNQAFCTVISALAAPGDEVILPAPWYFNHHMWLQMQGIRPVVVPFIGAEGASLTPAMLDERVTPRTRAIVVVTPNNPTGAVHSPAELLALGQFAAARRIALIVDETYRDFLPEREVPHALFSMPGWRETFVQLYSFSKVYSLTGYRVGSLIAGPRLMQAAEKILDTVTICPPHVGQLAALHGIEHLADFRAEKRALMADRAQALRTVFTANDLRYRLVACGAYFGWVEHPFEDETATAVARRLADRHDLLCLPGSMFGPGQERYLRFAFANLDAQAMPLLGERLRESLA